MTGIDELQRARELVAESASDLAAEGVLAAADVPVGVMIETPAAALLAEEFAAASDFISVGTNDLTQYTLAVDRLNDKIANLYQPTHPAVLRSLQTIIESGMRHGIDVGVCGEMASDPIYTPLLIGLGATELSMAPASIPEIKYLLTSSNHAEMRSLAFDILEESSGELIQSRLEDLYTERMSML